MGLSALPVPVSEAEAVDRIRALEELKAACAAAQARTTAALHGLNGRREGVTVNVARISGGGALNVVADNAVVRFNVRVPDAVPLPRQTQVGPRLRAVPPVELPPPLFPQPQQLCLACTLGQPPA